MGSILERLIEFLHDDCGWPLLSPRPDDLLFELPKAYFGFLRNEATKVNRVYQLRQMEGLRETVFVVDMLGHALHRFAIRRIPMFFTTRKARGPLRKHLGVSDMVFLVQCGEGNLAVVHFAGKSALQAHMAVLGPYPSESWNHLESTLNWDEITEIGWQFPNKDYVRFERRRSSVPCTKGSLSAISPGSVPLFDLACQAESVTQAEEDRLFETMGAGNVGARNEILRLNLRPAFDISYRMFHQFQHCGVVFEDILSEAIEGLIRAVDKYVPEKGHRFRSVAWQWMSSRAERMLAETLFPISVPYYVWGSLGPALRDKDVAASYYSASAEEICNTFEIPESAVPVFLAVAASLVSEGDSNAESDSGIPLSQEHTHDPFAIPRRVSSSELLERALKQLTVREAEVMRLRFGLAEYDRLTLEEVGAKLSLTRERIRQIEMRATKKLRIWAAGSVNSHTPDKPEAVADSGLLTKAEHLHSAPKTRQSGVSDPLEEQKALGTRLPLQSTVRQSPKSLDSFLNAVRKSRVRTLCPWAEILGLVGNPEDTRALRKCVDRTLEEAGIMCVPHVVDVAPSGYLTLYPATDRWP